MGRNLRSLSLQAKDYTKKKHTWARIWSRCGLSVPSNWLIEIGCGKSQGSLEIEN